MGVGLVRAQPGDRFLHQSRRSGYGVGGVAGLAAELDQAVLAAYDFSADDDVLAQLLALNQDIAADPATARGPDAEGLVGARVSGYRLMA